MASGSNLDLSAEPNLGDVFCDSYNFSDSEDSDEDVVEKNPDSEDSGEDGVEKNSGDEDEMTGEREGNDEVLDGVEEEAVIDVKLGISEALARENYLAAGVEVQEEKDRITVEKNLHLISQEVDLILDKIVLDLSLPYSPSDFQRVAVNTLGMQRNLILVSPTGRVLSSTFYQGQLEIVFQLFKLRSAISQFSSGVLLFQEGTCVQPLVGFPIFQAESMLIFA